MSAKLTKNIAKKIDRQSSSIETLKKLLVYYQEITDTIREPFIILDKKLCVVTANTAFYKTFKVIKIETEGKLIYKLGNNQWKSSKLVELLENILPKHKVFNDFEVTHKFPDIGLKTMMLNARQIDSKQLILLAFQDITEQKQLTADTNKMNAGLVEQHRKLNALGDAKDEFIALASHQLRTPATIVKQYIGILREGYAGKLSKKQMDMLENANLSNNRQLEIIEDLLRVARVDAGKVYLEKTSCDVVNLVDDVMLAQVITFDARKQNVVFNKPGVRVNADFDTKLMRMVLDNLFDNASKYSQNGATITISLKQTKTQTTISIDDSGVGILKKDQKKLFKRFSRIDNPLSVATPGTGLGLYWVKKIIDLHNGSIDVTSKINEGTKFTIKLPTSSQDTKPKEVIII